MLADTEWTLITELTRDHLLATVEPHEPLRACFGDELTGRLSLGPSSARNAIAVVRAVRDAGLMGPQPPLVQLLTALAGHPTVVALPVGARLREMLARVRATLAAAGGEGAGAAPDPFMATVLGGREVFIDRHGFRSKLRALHDHEQPAVLLSVAGEPGCGTSHAYRLIEHAAGFYGFRKVPVLLDESWTPEEVIELLAGWVAPGESPPQRARDPRKWYGHASNWLVRKAWESGAGWWLVIDELNHLPPASEVWDLVQELAIAVGYYGENRVRLVLLGYDGELDRKLRHRGVAERFEPLSEADVREFLAERLRERGPALAANEQAARVEAALARVLAAAGAPGAPGRCPTERLALAVEETAL